MNKKTMKKSLFMLAVTAIMIFAMSITTIAATKTKVTGLRQTYATDTTVRIEWTADPYADGYYIYLSTDGKNFKRQSSNKYPDTTSSTSYSIGRLSSAQKYYVKVAAVYKTVSGYNTYYNPGPLSDAISVVTQPGQVNKSTIKQTNATTKNVTLKWSYVPGASGYRVTVGGKSVIVWGTTATVAQNAGDYNSAKVEAFKQSNEGYRAYGYVSYSNEYMYSAPTTPKQVAAGKYGTLKWQPTENNNVKIGWVMKSGYGSTVSGYQVEIWSVGGKKKIATYNITSVYTQSKTFNINQVKNTGFKVKVRAYKTINGRNYYGNWSATKTIVPQAAAKITTRTGYRSFRATWPKIKNVTKYEVYVCKNTNASSKNQVWKKVATLGKNATSYTANNLTVGNYNGIYVIPTVKVAGNKTFKAEATWFHEAYLSSYWR